MNQTKPLLLLTIALGIFSGIATIVVGVLVTFRLHSLLPDYGVIDKSGHFVFSTEGYTLINHSHYSGGMLRTRATLNGKGAIRYLDRRGQDSFGRAFENAEGFKEGLAAVSEQGNWGFIDLKGDFAIPPKFHDAGSFSQGLAAVQENNLWGFIDKHGSWIIPPKFENVIPFSEGRAAVNLNGKIGFIDIHGELVVKPQYDEAQSFSEGLARVVTYQKGNPRHIVHYINTEGETVLNLNKILSKLAGCDYYPGRGPDPNQLLWQHSDEYIYPGKPKGWKRHPTGRLTRYFLRDGLILIEVNRKYGYIDRYGKLVVPLKYDYAETFSEGLAVVGKCLQPQSLNGDDTRYGFVDRSGNVILPETRYGVIDRSGNVIVPFIYSYMHPFSDGLALAYCVSPRSNRGFIDHAGRMIFRFAPDGCLGEFHEGLATVSKKRQGL